MRFAVLAVLFMFSGCSCHTTEPGDRSVLVVWGKMQEPSLAPGFNWAGPGSDFYDVSIRQQKKEVDAPCFSSDLQEVTVKVAVLYSIPEAKVTKIFSDFHGEPFEVLVAPRVQESIKEATASRTAEQIVKDREQVKAETLMAIRSKVGDILTVEDIVIENIGLSKQLTAAIEAKMVQEQEAAKAKFTNQKAEIDADIRRTEAKGLADATLLQAKADAESIKIRGEALRSSPGVVELQLIEKWNGVAPQIVSGSSGVNLLLPAAKDAK